MVKTGTEKQVVDGFSVRYEYAKIHGANDAPTIFQITLVIADRIVEGVAVALTTAWLLEKLEKEEAKVTKLKIDSVTVELDKDKIRKIVLEKIRKIT